MARAVEPDDPAFLHHAAAPQQASGPAAPDSTRKRKQSSPSTTPEPLAEDPSDDPIYRIGRLAFAIKEIGRVAPDQSIAEAATIMLANDFSQLPVMTGERNVKGVVTWASIGMRLAFGRKCEKVAECMEEAYIVSSDASLFSVIGGICKHGYALVQGKNKVITGILTTTDLSHRFRALSEPFLITGEIEKQLRKALADRGSFSPSELRQFCGPRNSKREIDSVNDLTFGEYIRILESPANWARMGLPLCRETFIKNLKEVCDIRNEIMHFHPEPILDDKLNILRRFTGLLQWLETNLPKGA